MIKLYLSVGHGGKDTGAVRRDPKGDIYEKDVNLIMGLAFLEEIKHYPGIEVMPSRTDDTFKDLAPRALEANSWGADYYLSIHNNAGGGDGFEAIHTIWEEHSKGDELAEYIADKVNHHTDQNIRRVFCRSMTSKRANYYAEIRLPHAPAVILEGAFMDSKDFEIIDTISEQKEFGRVYARAFADFVGAKRVEGTKKTTYEKEIEKAIRWAKENGITDGTRPSDPVTRQELWVMLKRMAKKII